ncbi:MAG: hypothetical protein V4722_12570 [Bacteroidota bacterium]
MIVVAVKPVTIEEIFETVKSKFPQYTVTLKRNKLLKFSYVEVRKSATIGAWIRLKDNKITVVGAIPSTLVRAMFGGLILIAFISGKLKKLTAEVGGVLQTSYA